MLLIFHVLIALLSLVYTTYLLFYPSRTKLRLSYGLVALTLGSGTYLVLSSHARILQACQSGLIYIAAISLLIVAAQHRLGRLTP